VVQSAVRYIPLPEAKKPLPRLIQSRNASPNIHRQKPPAMRIIIVRRDREITAP
jgi:hypothetical protein